jgi:hypothetical protein
MVHERLPGRAITELTFNPVIPPLPRAGGLRCSVVPPYALTSSPTPHRPCPPAGSQGATPGLEWTDYQHATRDPNPATPYPHLPAPAQVTGGRYTSQLLDTAENLPPKPSSDLRFKSYGLMRTLRRRFTPRLLLNGCFSFIQFHSYNFTEVSRQTL